MPFGQAVKLSEGHRSSSINLNQNVSTHTEFRDHSMKTLWRLIDGPDYRCAS